MFKGNYRWVICSLLFFATTVNYIDRQILSLVKEFLDAQYGWTKTDFGLLNSAFQVAYGTGLLFFGWFVDRFGVKIGYAVSMVGWSLAAMAHALVQLLPENAKVRVVMGTFEHTFGLAALSVTAFIVCRVLLGVAEAGNFPAAIKSTAQWFPKRERAFATSLFNSGANVGALLAPAVVPLLAIKFGWSMPFVVAGLVGFVWLGFWIWIYDVPEKHARVAKAELDHILSDRDDESKTTKLRWFHLLAYRQTWSFVFAKLLTDPVWWFFLIWLPDYFKTTLLLDIKKSWPLLVSIYGIITVLSIFGGWVTGHLASRGWSVTRARKTCMVIFALCVLPVMFATSFGRFNVDQKFFAKLEKATYTVEKTVTVEGKTVKEKQTLPVNGTVAADLQALAGKSYSSIDDFLRDAGQQITPEKAQMLKQPLADCARDNLLFWIAVLLIGLAGAAHQAWSANLFSTVSDMFPKKAVASIVGLGGMAGSAGGFAFPIVTGLLLDHYQKLGRETTGYTILFTFCAVAYLIAFVINHFLAPKFEQTKMD